MLTVRQFNINDVVSVKLSTGEELVAYFIAWGDDHITFRKPAVLTAGPNGQPILAPFLMTVDVMGSGNVDIASAHIVTINPTQADFSTQYTQAVSGVVTTDSGKSKLIT